MNLTFINWDTCIQATEKCNLENCAEGVSCCAVGCMGTPTWQMVVLFVALITTIVLTFYFYGKKKKELGGQNEIWI
jgi:hypothetical protein